jgi:hypothetical protein
MTRFPSISTAAMMAVAVATMSSSVTAFQTFGIPSSLYMQRVSRLGVYPEVSGAMPPIASSSPVQLSDSDALVKGAAPVSSIVPAGDVVKSPEGVPKPSGLATSISKAGAIHPDDKYLK